MKILSLTGVVLILGLSAVALAENALISKIKPDDNTATSDLDFSHFKNDILSMLSSLKFQDYLKPLKGLTALDKGVEPNFNTATLGPVITEDNKYLIKLNVKGFAPEDITVRAVDGYVIVKANHKEKENENSFNSRQFMSRYMLPDGFNPKHISTDLKDGVLTVSVPKKDNTSFTHDDFSSSSLDGRNI